MCCLADSGDEKMPEQKLEVVVGTKELKDVLDLALAVGTVIKQVMADGKVGLEDVSTFLTLIPAIGPAVEKIDQIPGELKDLTEAELAELVSHVMAKLAVDDARARGIIQASLNVAAAGFGLVKAIMVKSEPVPTPA